jgi:hypothetical protein
MVRALSAFLEFCYLVRRNVINESTLQQIDEALARFTTSAPSSLIVVYAQPDLCFHSNTQLSIIRSQSGFLELLMDCVHQSPNQNISRP